MSIFKQDINQEKDVEIRGDKEVSNNRAKWLIFLTHWGYLTCTIQALFALYLVTSVYVLQRTKKGKSSKLRFVLISNQVFPFQISLRRNTLVQNCTDYTGYCSRLQPMQLLQSRLFIGPSFTIVSKLPYLRFI